MCRHTKTNTNMLPTLLSTLCDYLLSQRCADIILFQWNVSSCHKSESHWVSSGVPCQALGTPVESACSNSPPLKDPVSYKQYYSHSHHITHNCIIVAIPYPSILIKVRAAWLHANGFEKNKSYNLQVRFPSLSAFQRKGASLSVGMACLMFRLNQSSWTHRASNVAQVLSLKQMSSAMMS